MLIHSVSACRLSSMGGPLTYGVCPSCCCNQYLLFTHRVVIDVHFLFVILQNQRHVYLPAPPTFLTCHSVSGVVPRMRRPLSFHVWFVFARVLAFVVVGGLDEICEVFPCRWSILSGRLSVHRSVWSAKGGQSVGRSFALTVGRSVRDCRSIGRQFGQLVKQCF